MGGPTGRHTTISSHVTVQYPFHPLQGCPIKVLRAAPRHGRGVVICEHPDGGAVQIPVWMLRPEASCAQVSSVPLFDLSALLLTAELIDLLTHE